MLARLWPAILCALALPLCGLLIRPYVETGVIDDGSYIRTAQVLARTGHIVYNGGATAMLGWQLYLGAAFIKLFGFSFTAARSAVLLVAMATAFLLQRTFVRAGIGEWNATIGTLTFVLSPLFLPLSFTFMTDVPGLFCTVLCLYACLRALQAQTTGSAFAWICFAIASNAVGGTVRQTAWLGTLVIVPCTLWLLRRRPRLLQAGLLVWIAGVAAIFAFLHWFYLQPYALRENVTLIGHTQIRGLFRNVTRSALDLPAYLLLPILLMFVPAFPWRDRRAVRFASWMALCCLLVALSQMARGTLYGWLQPIGDWFTIHGAVDGLPIHGSRPVILTYHLLLLIAGATLAAVICLVVLVLTRPASLPLPPTQLEAPSWHQLAVLLIPVTLCYALALLARAIYLTIFDRYLLVPVFIALLFLLRFYQDRVQPRHRAASLLVLALFAAYGVATTHDAFSMYRARLAAVDELRSAGIEATAIDAGLDTNIVTQIDQAGSENDPRIKEPSNIFIPQPAVPLFDPCRPGMAELVPAIKPRYELSFDPALCAGPSRFAPVTYHEWLGPHSVTIYIVNLVR